MKYLITIVVDYNKHKGGFDHFNQIVLLIALYFMKSRRWWIKICYYLLDATVVKSYVLYKVHDLHDPKAFKFTDLQFS